MARKEIFLFQYISWERKLNLGKFWFRPEKFLRQGFKIWLFRGDVPGGPVVKTLPSNTGIVGSIPGQGPKIPHALSPKNQNIKQTILWEIQ